MFIFILLIAPPAFAGCCFSKPKKEIPKAEKVKAAVQRMPSARLRMLHTAGSVDFKTMNLSPEDTALFRGAVTERVKDESVKELDPALYAIDKMKDKRKAVIIPSHIIQAIIAAKK